MFAQRLDAVNFKALSWGPGATPGTLRVACSATIWMESSDNQDGHFGGRGEVMIVAARR